MADIKTRFAGLELCSPVIVSSSGLTDSAEKNRKWADAGAGAVVLKSLFEEQIHMEAEQYSDPAYAESGDYMAAYVRGHKLAEYLQLIRDTKSVCGIPVIASINCFSDSEWVDFAKHIKEAGADALEINILSLQTDPHAAYGEFELRHIDILRHVKRVADMPVIMKFGDNLSNPVALIDSLYANGAAAVVLFNRFYPLDIDVDKLTHTTGSVLSTGADLSSPLRWVGIASARVDRIDYAVSGGVHRPEDVVKALLAGASAVEVCSAIYAQKEEFIRSSVEYLRKWMDGKGFERVAQFRAMLNAKEVKGVNMWERTQFLRYFGTKE